MVRGRRAAAAESRTTGHHRSPVGRRRDSPRATSARIRIRTGVSTSESSTRCRSGSTGEASQFGRWRAVRGGHRVVSSRSRAAFVSCRRRTFAVLRTSRRPTERRDPDHRRRRCIGGRLRTTRCSSRFAGSAMCAHHDRHRRSCRSLLRTRFCGPSHRIRGRPPVGRTLDGSDRFATGRVRRAGGPRRPVARQLASARHGRGSG